MRTFPKLCNRFGFDDVLEGKVKQDMLEQLDHGKAPCDRHVDSTKCVSARPLYISRGQMTYLVACRKQSLSSSSNELVFVRFVGWDDVDVATRFIRKARLGYCRSV